MFKFIIYLKIIKYDVFLNNFLKKMKNIYFIIIIFFITIITKMNIYIIIIFNLY